MKPLIAVWPIAVPFWIAYLWAFWPELPLMRRARPMASAKGSQDAGSLRVIAITQALGAVPAFALAFFAPSMAIHEHRELAYWIGVGMLIGGALLRRHCFRILGRQFTGAVLVLPGDAVISRGAYRWVRHPSYTGGMLMFAGIGFALGSWISVALLFVSALVAYSYRVSVEERALLATQGDVYREYMRGTARFIPFVF